MSGIAGLMTTDGNTPQIAVLDRLAAAIAHRGPDGAGQYASSNVGMVHRALTPGPPDGPGQPLTEPGGAALVGDGAIYNARELRAGLAAGMLPSQSDWAVPLHLFCRGGLDFARKLRGSYALALHDPASGHLVLARDPFGVKPLYYAETRSCFAFASEPQALIKAGLAVVELVRQVRNELLQLQFTTGRDTIYAGIKRVLPGETVVVAEGRVVERRRIDALPGGAPQPVELEPALSRLGQVLEDSVRVHMRDVGECGLLLSGGIDSAALLAVMAALEERPVRALTIGYSNGAAADERPLARTLAQTLGAEHLEIEFREADFWHLLPEVAAAMDDPAADYAVLPTYKLARAARESGLKVVLSGEGGDELFGGYGRYRSVMRPWWAGGRVLRGRGNFEGLGLLRGELTGWRDGMVAADVRAAAEGRTRLQVAQATDCTDWLPNDLLTKLDRCFMAHGVEARTPLLDQRVAELAFRLPDDLKVRDGLGKWLLRRWLQALLPPALPLLRRKGAAAPVAEWLRRRGPMLGPLVARQPGIREICLPEAVEKLYAGLKGKREGFAAWTLLYYALWHRAHIMRLAPERDVFQTLSTFG